MPPFDPRVYIKLMFYSIVFILFCTYLFADTRTIKGDKFEQDGQWCFVQVVYNTKDDVVTKKEELICSEDPEGLNNDKIKELEKLLELEKAKKPGYWELFAAFYYKDDNAPLYCRKYARPDSWFKRPGNACLTPNGEWEIVR